MWMPVFGPLPKPEWFTAGWKVGYVIAVRFTGAILGNVLMWSGTVLYPIYAPGERYWGISPIADQSTAGVIMMVEGTFLALGVLAWVFFEVAREGIEKQRLLDLAQERGVELDEQRRPARGRRRPGRAGSEERIVAGRAEPCRRDRARAWLVTGPLGRGLAFAIDFAVALRTVLAAAPRSLGSRADADQRHRAARLARAGRGRGSRRGRRARRRARRPGDGAGDADARLPQGQGAALAGDPAARLRRRARGGDPRLAARVVRTGAARLRRSARSATPASRWSRPPRTRARRSASSSRSACGPAAELGEYKGLEVGASRDRGPRRDRRPRGRADPRGLRQARAGRARRRRGRRRC